jgi:hypothetical protein
VAGDNFSPNPGNKLPQGPYGICPSGSFTPFVACDSQGECGSITAARFNQPGVPTTTPGIAETSGPVKQKYYSYNYGAARCCAPWASRSCAEGACSIQRLDHGLLGACMQALSTS